MSMDRKEDFDDSMSLLSLNHLSYESPSSVCAASQRNQSQINFQPRSYAGIDSGTQMSLVFNAGSAMTLGPSSMINLKMRVANPNAGGTDALFWAWGNNIVAANDGERYTNSGGSIMNLFSEVSCNARSGELLFRELYSNQSKTTSRLYKINKERRGYLGMMGGATHNTSGVLKFPLFPLNQDISFSIPLGELSAMFNTSAPIPPQLLSGATLRLSLAKPSQAITLYTSAAGTALASTNQAATVVSITEATCYLDQVELFDSVNSLILSSANSLETSGLQYAYSTLFTSQYPVGGTGNIDVQLSAARIKNIVVKFIPRVAPDWGTPAGYTGPMSCASIAQVSSAIDRDANGLQGMKFRFRLGSNVMPLFDIQTATQAYAMLKDALCNISFDSCEDPDSLKVVNKLSPCAIEYSDYVHNDSQNAGASGLGSGCFMVGLNFERSNALNISGLSSSNNRVLTFEWSGIEADLYNAVISVEYLQIANVSTSNVVVNK